MEVCTFRQRGNRILNLVQLHIGCPAGHRKASLLQRQLLSQPWHHMWKYSRQGRPRGCRQYNVCDGLPLGHSADPSVPCGRRENARTGIFSSKVSFDTVLPTAQKASFSNFPASLRSHTQATSCSCGGVPGCGYHKSSGLVARHNTLVRCYRNQSPAP